MLAITVDVEDWYHGPAITGSPFSRFRNIDEFFVNWTGRYDYLTKSTERVLNILHELGIKATFFIVADVTEHYPGLVEQIAAGGHEIACHGLHHMCKIHPSIKTPLISQAEFENATLEAREKLQAATNQDVVGYRAPAAYISGWMIDSLEKIGFKYDSSVSVNSFYNKSNSRLRGVETQPYYPGPGSLEPGGERGVVELPWPYFKLGFRFPTGGGPVLRFLGSRYVAGGLKQSLKRGHTLFYFHPIDISAEKFPDGFSGARPFYWSIKGNVVEKRIRRIIGNIDAKFGTCREIAEEMLAFSQSRP